MVKETNKWTKEGTISDPQGFKIKKGKGGERFWDLEDLPTIIENYIQRTTIKRYRMAYERIRDFVRKTSDLLFLMIDREAIGKMYNPYYGKTESGIDYSKEKVWQALSKDYNSRKSDVTRDRFWIYEGHLRDWLRSTLPSQIFGTPEVVINPQNNKARGMQDMYVTVRPFPRAGRPNINSDDQIYKELFGRHEWNGTFASNEDMRPIMAPAMRKLVDTRIKNGIKRIFKEVWEK